MADIAKMKSIKVDGLSEVVSEMLKASSRPVQSGWLTCAMLLSKMVRVG